MDEILFYIILEGVFFIIFTESMDIFFEKKNMSYFIVILIWIGYFGLDSIRVRYITNPIFLLLVRMISDFVLSIALYYGSMRKKFIWIAIVDLMGMLLEVIVTYIFIFTPIPLIQIRIPGAFISESLFLLLIRGGKLYHDKKLNLEIQKQQIVFDKQIELYKEQIRERREADLNIKNIKHDMKNHLICIWECLEQENWYYAKKYVDNLMNNSDFFKSSYGINSGNIVIDALLNHKNTMMKQLQIKMDIHLEIPDNLQFNDVDICVILGNCLDNSIEAVSKIEDKRKRIVKIEIIYRKNNLLIKIANSYIGKLKKDKYGNLLSTKADKENHGIGLYSVKKVVSKYDGIMNNRIDDQMFIIQILLYESGKNYI